MPDYQFTSFPIPGKQVDFEAIQNEITTLQERASELQRQLDALTASEVPYDHTASGLTATNVQDAIDEIDEVVDDTVPKTREINGLDLTANRVLKSAQFAESVTGEKMLANLLYSQVNSWDSGAKKSIKLAGDTYLNASAIDGVKASLDANTNDLNNFKGTHYSGLYYWDGSAQNNCPLGWSAVLIVGYGSVTCQLVFGSGGAYVRRFANDSWSNWIDLGGTDVSSYRDTTSVPNASVVSVKSVVLPAGRYVISGSLIYPSNNNPGYRRCAITGGDLSVTVADEQVPPCQGATTRVSCSAIVIMNGSEAINLVAEHNCGSAVSVSWILRAVRI